jgi:aspartate/methionine/tyrosine aminotransferase
MQVSQRSQVPAFTVMEIIAAANARRAAGHDVLNLCVGEPSSAAPEDVRRRAAGVMSSGTLGYTEAAGLPELRRRIAGHYGRWYGVDLDPRQVAVTTGSSGAFLLAFLAAFEPGDRVALARPGYPAYRNILVALGCHVVDLPCGPENRWRPTVDQLEALDRPVRGLVVAGPANPTGTLVDPVTLEALAGWCHAHDVRLVSDEIYHGISYDAAGQAQPGAGAPTAATALDRGALVVSSFSKYWAMTGWRLGWLVLPDDLVGPVDALAGNLALCAPTPAQHAAVEAFTEASYADAARNVVQYAESRRLVLDRLDDLGWSRTAPADGAFYVYADVSGSGLDSVTYCARLLAEADVALTPGTDFDRVGGRDWLRLSVSPAPEVVARALDRIGAWRRAL